MAVSSPVPANGSQEVAIPVRLSFVLGETVEAAGGYLVFVGTDRNEVDNAFYRNHPNVQVYETRSLSLGLPDLKNDTTYFWRVDPVDEQMESLLKGSIWRFTTRKDEGTVFVPDLSVSHDFLAEGVGATGFDGFIGKGAGETADRIEIAGGRLHLTSTRARYEGNARPLGPLVYKTVTGDFKTTVRVADYQDTAYNNCGLMARAANPDDAGEGDDWISIDYFPLYGGIYGRMTDENHRVEVCDNGQGRNADRWIQLELVGNLFSLRHSSDGEHWVELPCSPITRNDLVNVPLQVGVFNATYTDNQGHAAFEHFQLTTTGQVATARVHYPEDGAANVPSARHLSWIPGVGADYHDIYFGTSREAVNNGHSKMTRGGSVYKGRQEAMDIEYAFSDLQDGQTYYWRVDEVAGEDIHTGDIWHFTVYDRSLADFGRYDSTEHLERHWQVRGTGDVTLTTGEEKSLRLNYDNSVSPYYAMVEYTFPDNQDWMSSLYGFRYLRVTFMVDRDHFADPLFMVFEDNDWGTNRTVVEYPGDRATLKKMSRVNWDIDLQELVSNNPAFRLSHVRKMALSVGHPNALAAGQKGSLTLGGIRIDYQGKTPAGGDIRPTYIHPDRFVRAIPFRNIDVTGGLWAERMDVNRTVSLPHVWGRCEKSTTANGDLSLRLDNFRRAAGEKPGGFTGTYFNDSDVYKIIEGTAYSLENHPDPQLEAYTDKVIDSIAAAQWEDGYLYTFYSLPEHQPDKRWTNVGAMHELYCAGHLIEAAVAYYEATGKRRLLDAAIKFADHICQTFGPGKRMTPPGHQEIELALMRLHHLTGNRKYMDTAKFFIDQRGRVDGGRTLYGTYSQDHMPFVRQEKAVGHSVRAGYMFCGATDIAMVNHDEAYANALFRLWDNITNTKTYITGGIGQPGGPEGFAGDYELGNNCYAETCSGIAFAMWNHRLHTMTGESKYMDIAERTLLNNMLSSLSQEGDKHYYTNPLMTDGRQRWEWPGHDCACCPSNLVRVIASIGGYVYTCSDDTLHVNMYMPSEADIPMADTVVHLTQETRYPWQGDIRLTLKPKKSETFSLKLRIPGWASNRPLPGNLYQYLDQNTEAITLKVNGQPVETAARDGYVTLSRKWEFGDTVNLYLPMPVRRVITHPNATMNKGLVAIERGPIVYCAEFKDNDFDVRELKLPDDTEFKTTYDKDLFNGAVTVQSSNGVKLIPYYLYSNRGAGWMRVWIPRQ